MNASISELEPSILSLVRGGDSSHAIGRPSPEPLAVLEKRPRILFVDDEPQLRSLVERVLFRTGFETETAEDGAEAWAALNDREFDLLITDNVMPRLTGLQLIRKVRAAGMSIPIILASGTLNTLLVGQLPLIGCDATLAKPFTSGELIAVVRNTLGTVASSQASPKAHIPRVEELHALAQPHRRWGINE